MLFDFEMWICPDSWPYLSEMNSGRAGFFFAATGFPESVEKFDAKL